MHYYPQLCLYHPQHICYGRVDYTNLDTKPKIMVSNETWYELIYTGKFPVPNNYSELSEADKIKYSEWVDYYRSRSGYKCEYPFEVFTERPTPIPETTQRQKVYGYDPVKWFIDDLGRKLYGVTREQALQLFWEWTSEVTGSDKRVFAYNKDKLLQRLGITKRLRHRSGKY